MLFAFLIIFFFYPETKGVRILLHPCSKLLSAIAEELHPQSRLTCFMQITLEEVEVVFGSGAGQFVKQALGRRGSIRGEIHESGSESEETTNPAKGNAVVLNDIPKPTKRLVSNGM